MDKYISNPIDSRKVYMDNNQQLKYILQILNENIRKGMNT